MAIDIMKILSKKSLVVCKYCTVTYSAIYIQLEKPSIYCRGQHMPLKAFCGEKLSREEFFCYTNQQNSFTKSDEKICSFMKHQRQK